MKVYKIPYIEANTEFSEKNSRFLGQIFYVTSEEAAREKIAQVKKKYHDARHHCWCYLLHDGTTRYSDDGEPQGTAGQPMLNVFQREKVENVCCVVTRYFGGVLLGAGGLTRAYSKSAKLTLDAAGIAEMRPWRIWTLSCPYPLLDRVKLLCTSCEGRIEHSVFGQDVTLTILLPLEQEESFSHALTEWSGGQLVPEHIEARMLPGKRRNI